MKPVKFYVGIDIAKDNFAASIFTAPGAPLLSLTETPNDVSGFDQFEAWLVKNQVSQDNSIICLEATGVYGEVLSYWFTAKGYRVAVEPPLKVKRAFKDKSHKNDKADSRKISEYAYRFADELRIWHPKSEVVEQIRVLLMTREQLVGQKTALSNTLKSLGKKVVQTPLANDIYEENISRFDTQIKKIEKELQKQIDQHPDLKKTVSDLDSIPGVGLLLAANFLVATDGFKNELAVQYRKSAAFIGICPYEFNSGTSVHKRPRTPKYGPPRLRKLLHLAARSVVTHKVEFQRYYEFKQIEGKEKSLIINNVSNKILKIMCAIVRTQRPYVDNYVSVHPKYALANVD